jgi:hypothetical protein
MGRFSRGAVADRGAAALEFALVVPVLVALVFGMIDYGLYFTDSLGARDGVRVAARQASVAKFGASCSSSRYSASGTDSQLDSVACLAIDQTGAIGGDAYAHVSAPSGWVVDDNDYVLVCILIAENGVTGLTPMPNGSTVRAKFRMRIEQPPLSPKSSDDTGLARLRSSPALIGDPWTPWCS